MVILSTPNTPNIQTYKAARNVPVELGVIGEIRDGRYIERTKEPMRRETGIKVYGEVVLCDKFGIFVFKNFVLSIFMCIFAPKEPFNK